LLSASLGLTRSFPVFHHNCCQFFSSNLYCQPSSQVSYQATTLQRKGQHFVWKCIASDRRASDICPRRTYLGEQLGSLSEYPSCEGHAKAFAPVLTSLEVAVEALVGCKGAMSVVRVEREECTSRASDSGLWKSVNVYCHSTDCSQTHYRLGKPALRKMSLPFADQRAG